MRTITPELAAYLRSRLQVGVAAFAGRVEVDSPVIDPAWACPLDAGIGPTESKTYENLNGTTTDADGRIWYASGGGAYFADGHQTTDGPYPNQACHGLGFADYTPAGDGGGTNLETKNLFR